MSLLPLKLKQPISRQHDIDPQDIFNTKTVLDRMGYYRTPPFGITDIPEPSLFDDIKTFQKDQGLKVDGVMKPGGPTEAAINHMVQRNPPKNKTPVPIGRGKGGKFTPDDLHPLASNRATEDLRNPWPRPPRDRSKEIQVANPAAALIPLGLGLGAGALGQKALEETEKHRRQNRTDRRSPSTLFSQDKELYLKGGRAPFPSLRDKAPKMPTPPGFEPPERPDTSKEEFPEVEYETLRGTDLPKFDEAKPKIYFTPDISDEINRASILENKGNEETRQHLERVRDYYLRRYPDWIHIAGGRKIQPDGSVEELGEYRVRAHFSRFWDEKKGKWRSTILGSHLVDLTFQKSNGKRVHIQSVDVDKNGKPTKRELDNAEKIRKLDPSSDVLLISKDWQIKKNKK